MKCGLCLIKKATVKSWCRKCYEKHVRQRIEVTYTIDLPDCTNVGVGGCNLDCSACNFNNEGGRLNVKEFLLDIGNPMGMVLKNWRRV